ncbi:glutamine-tRNA ligase, partial [Trifolium pratense]
SARVKLCCSLIVPHPQQEEQYHKPCDGTLISVSRLEYHVREELNKTAPRTMVVLHPLKVVITNLEANSTIEVDGKKWPDAQADDPSAFYKELVQI